MVMRPLVVATAVLLSSAAVSHAQIAVQQPVVRTTGVATTVSVPDRGSILLGGVSSAESARQSYGPLRTGTSRGYGLSSGSISASVQIIDLHAMDEAILSSVPDSPVPVTMRSRTVEPDRNVVANDQRSLIEKANNFERMARQAEAAGKTGVARLHWQMAAKYGSTVAQSKLQQKPSEVAVAK